MEQMQINPHERIEIDYQDWPLTSATQKLQPVVFKDGDGYSCLLGPDSKLGIYGTGQTAYEAVTAWEQNLHDRLAAGEEDEVLRYVKRSLDIQDQF